MIGLCETCGVELEWRTGYHSECDACEDKRDNRRAVIGVLLAVFVGLPVVVAIVAWPVLKLLALIKWLRM